MNNKMGLKIEDLQGKVALSIKFHRKPEKIPSHLKKIYNLAQTLDRQIMTLEEAVKILTPVAKESDGKLDVSERYKYISFDYFNNEGLIGYHLLDYSAVHIIHESQ